MNSKNFNEKFILLNVELKREILEYLSIYDVFQNCIILNKKFLAIIKREGIYKIIIQETKNLLDSFERINLFSSAKALKAKLTNLGEFSKARKIDIISFIFALKLKNESKIEIIHKIDNSVRKSLNRFWIKDDFFNYEPYKAKLIFPIIHYKSNLIEINFFANKLGEDKTIFNNLCKAIKENKCLRKLYITENEIGKSDYHLKNLSEALKFNKNLKFLNLEKNFIGKIFKDDSFYIAGIITNISSLEHFNLNSNFLGSFFNDSKIIFKALKENKTIKEIYFSRNKFGKFANHIDEISDNIKEIKQVIEIYIFGNNFALLELENLNKIIENKINLKII